MYKTHYKTQNEFVYRLIESHAFLCFQVSVNTIHCHIMLKIITKEDQTHTWSCEVRYKIKVNLDKG